MFILHDVGREKVPGYNQIPGAMAAVKRLAGVAPEVDRKECKLQIGYDQQSLDNDEVFCAILQVLILIK